MNPIADKQHFQLKDLLWHPAYYEVYNRTWPVAERQAYGGRVTLDRLFAFRSNGATCAPDCILGVDVSLAAHWHDFMYSLGGYPYDRYVADQLFYQNLLNCGLPRLLAWVYYSRVRAWGYMYFGTGESFSLWKTLKLMIRRYVQL